jgi:hypothetical protein
LPRFLAACDSHNFGDRVADYVDRALSPRGPLGILGPLPPAVHGHKAGVDPHDGAIERELARKDGSRRFAKLVEERAQTFSGQPPLLSGATFEACLERYKALLEHVERMWADACEFYTRGNYPFAAFFSILVIEEIGKLSRLAEDLMHYDLPRAAAQSGTVERSHRRKHFMGVVSGALINARLERVPTSPIRPAVPRFSPGK